MKQARTITDLNEKYQKRVQKLVEEERARINGEVAE